MSLATIKATTAVADFTLATVSYKTGIDLVEITTEAPEEDETVYSNEANGGESNIGTPVTRLRWSGPLKFGAATGIPFLPLSDYQGMAWEKTFTTGCTVSGILNVNRSYQTAPAGRTRRFQVDARNTGPIAVAWDDGAT